MRKIFLLAAVLAACAKTETKPVDTAAPAMAPAAPTPLTAADLAGTWNGTTKNAGSDSVLAKWTVKSTSDSTGTLTYDGTKVTVPFKTTFGGDSSVATSEPYTPPSAKKGSPKVRFISVGRIKDGQLQGTATVVLASKPDSVLAHHTFSATKAP